MSFPEDPWHLTVIRTQGVLLLRPEKSWRPIVSVTLVDRAHPPYEVVLGTDGQNPNLKMPFVLYDVDEATRLDIRIWHQSGKRRRKRHIVGSAYVRLGELFKRQECAGADVPIHLRCPPPQKRSSKLNNGRSNAVTLTVRMRAPSALLSGSCATSSTSATLVASPAPSVCGDKSDAYSEDEESVCSVEGIPDVDDIGPEPESPWQSPPDVLTDSSTTGLRRRRRIKPYYINTSDEEDGSVSCASSDEDLQATCTRAPEQEDECTSPRLLPILPQFTVYNEDGEEVGVPLSLVEKVVDRFAPYREMRDPGCDFGHVQRRLMGEWYTVAGALLAVVGLNAAVFGFSSGTLFDVDSLAQRAVLFGSVVAAVGLVADIWFLVQYAGADPDKFERHARDVYSSHFFFCLKCRLPTLCLFVSVCALMFFVLAVAWASWPQAVLVMSALAGACLTLQYLVFGVHRGVGMLIWVVRRAWQAVRWSAASVESGSGQAAVAAAAAGGSDCTAAPTRVAAAAATGVVSVDEDARDVSAKRPA